MKWTVCSCIMGLALLLVPQQGQAMLVTVGSATVTVGNTFSININVADAIDLTSWQFDLGYNPTLIHANLVSEGPFLSAFGTTIFPPTSFGPGDINNATGLISLVTNSFVDLPPLPNGNGVLATIHFTGMNSGVSPLIASNVLLNLSDSGFDVRDGSVSLSPVPLPSTVTFMSVGLGILYFFFTQRRQRFGQPGH